MSLVLGRVTSILAVAGGWALFGVRAVLDLIGYATLPEDSRIAAGLLEDFFLWLLSIPWWIPWGFALVSTVVLLWVSWPRDRAAKQGFVSMPHAAPASDAQPQEGEPENRPSFAPDARNISGTTISNKLIRIQDLVQEGDTLIADVIFDQCTLVGPAIIIMSGGYLKNAKFVGITNIEHALIEIPSHSTIAGVVMFRNCVFKDTRLRLIGIMGSIDSLNSVRRAFSIPEKASIIRDDACT